MWALRTSMHVTPRTIPCASPASIPAVYAFRYHVASGDLISYGPDTIDPYRRAAGYIDRILKGEKPAPSGAASDED
jgi:putative ABC transport system substrate-binding protein